MGNLKLQESKHSTLKKINFYLIIVLAVSAAVIVMAYRESNQVLSKPESFWDVGEYVEK